MAEGHRGSFGGRWLPLTTLQPVRPHEILGATHVPVRWVPPEDRRPPFDSRQLYRTQAHKSYLVESLWVSSGLTHWCQVGLWTPYVPTRPPERFPLPHQSVCWPHPVPCTAPKGFVPYSPPAAYTTPQPNCITGIKN